MKLLAGAIAIAIIGGAAYTGGALFTKAKFDEIAQQEANNYKNAGFITNLSEPESTGLLSNKYALTFIHGKDEYLLYIDNNYGLGTVTSKYSFSEDSIKTIGKRFDKSVAKKINEILDNSVTKYSAFADELAVNMNFDEIEDKNGFKVADGSFNLVLHDVNKPNNVDFTMDLALDSLSIDVGVIKGLKLSANTQNIKLSADRAFYNYLSKEVNLENLEMTMGYDVDVENKSLDTKLVLKIGKLEDKKFSHVESKDTFAEIELKDFDLKPILAKCPNINPNNKSEISYCISSILNNQNGKIITDEVYTNKFNGVMKLDSEINGGEVHHSFKIDLSRMGDDSSISFYEKAKALYGNGTLTIDKKVVETTILKNMQSFFIQMAKDKEAQVLEYDLEYKNGSMHVNGQRFF